MSWQHDIKEAHHYLWRLDDAARRRRGAKPLDKAGLAYREKELALSIAAAERTRFLKDPYADQRYFKNVNGKGVYVTNSRYFINHLYRCLNVLTL